MGMNAQLHILLDSEDLDALQKEADNLKITISELCRQKLLGSHPLQIIASQLNEINSKLNLKRKKQFCGRRMPSKIAV